MAFLHPHGVIRDWQIKDEWSFDQVLLPALAPATGRTQQSALGRLDRRTGDP